MGLRFLRDDNSRVCLGHPYDPGITNGEGRVDLRCPDVGNAERLHGYACR